jgi:hypothetical protein
MRYYADSSKIPKPETRPKAEFRTKAFAGPVQIASHLFASYFSACHFPATYFWVVISDFGVGSGCSSSPLRFNWPDAAMPDF